LVWIVGDTDREMAMQPWEIVCYGAGLLLVSYVFWLSITGQAGRQSWRRIFTRPPRRSDNEELRLPPP
jgi:hypothetical protein